MFCLGGTFRAMVNGGEFHANDNTINLGQDVVDLIDWMRIPEQSKRPSSSEVLAKLADMKIHFDS